MHYKSLLLLSVLSFSQPIYALNMSEEPLHCPSLSSIISTGVNDAGSGTLGWWAFNLSHYDTSEEWTFGLLVSATDRETAIEMGNENIKSLKSVMGPFELNKGKWSCFYSDAKQEMMGLAITPSIDVNVTHLSNILRKK